MKKILNNTRGITTALTTVLAAGLLLSSCGGDKEPESRTQEEIMNEVNTIKAIGKVVPEDGWSIVSSSTEGIILRLEVQEGDTVSQGQLLMVLDPGNAELDVLEAQARLRSLEEEGRSTTQDLNKARISAEDLRKIYETSQRLFARNAETREKVDTDYSNWQQQEQVVLGFEQRLKAQSAAEAEQRISIDKVQSGLSDFQVTAIQDGIITELTAQVGQHVGSSEELARIVEPGHVLVEAEVDELFADQVQTGQRAFLISSGRQDTLAHGQVSYASPVLSNKSILYETSNEGEDRRVRRIKIQVEQSQRLPINAKVDVHILMN